MSNWRRSFAEKVLYLHTVEKQRKLSRNLHIGALLLFLVSIIADLVAIGVAEYNDLHSPSSYLVNYLTRWLPAPECSFEGSGSCANILVTWYYNTPNDNFSIGKAKSLTENKGEVK